METFSLDVRPIGPDPGDAVAEALLCVSWYTDRIAVRPSLLVSSVNAGGSQRKFEP
jgi:hypothetical protein